MPANVNHYDVQPVYDAYANVQGRDLAAVANDVQKVVEAIRSAAGRPIQESKFTTLQLKLLNRFSGVTSAQRRFPMQGLWPSGPEVFQDRVVVFSVMHFSHFGGSRLLRNVLAITSSDD